MAKSGRPEAGEYADYAAANIARVQGDDIVAALQSQLDDAMQLLTPIPEVVAGTLVYAPGKWTLKQVAGHLSDDERIFAYRCLSIARGDQRELPGFEEELYVQSAAFNSLPFADLLEELRMVRQASIALFRGLSAEAWMRRGVVNGYSATVRGLAFHIAGHELHHLDIVRTRYLRAG